MRGLRGNFPSPANRLPRNGFLTLRTIPRATPVGIELRKTQLRLQRLTQLQRFLELDVAGSDFFIR